ncbi:hypothetical protein ETB97_011803 [Aspergillus alliaceus]|uniref:Cysteine-rich transmembrane domain-containing protein n=1 Tax=Petromyces alliaceus TaxID=209559 RepID=A0A8H5ZUU4_PETAA|nr:hypothetical protein ETB97_011803 [Aspergillus burnettii]
MSYQQPYQQPPPQGYYPPPGGQYPPPQPMQYQQPPPQEEKKDRGCLTACLMAMCCCFLCEETCECCIECVEYPFHLDGALINTLSRPSALLSRFCQLWPRAYLLVVSDPTWITPSSDGLVSVAAKRSTAQDELWNARKTVPAQVGWQ